MAVLRLGSKCSHTTVYAPLFRRPAPYHEPWSTFLRWVPVIRDKAVISKSAIFFVQSDSQILLYRLLDRFKLIFLLLYFYQASSAKWFKHFFAGTAYRAFPIIRQIFKPGSFGNFSSAVPSVRIIKISAVNRLALIHFLRFSHPSSRLYKTLIKIEI